MSKVTFLDVVMLTISLTAGNLIYQWMFNGEYNKALDRSFFQFAALVIAWMIWGEK